MRRLYFEEYIKVWDKYIADVRVVKLDSLEKSLQVARQLSGVDSPLAAFLRGVARETTLVEPQARGRLDERHQGRQCRPEGRRRPSARWRRCWARSRCRAPSSRRRGRRSKQMVDDHFEPIRRLVAGTPPPMDEIMKMFNEVYVQLAAIDAAQKSKSAPPPAGGSRARQGGRRAAAGAGALGAGEGRRRGRRLGQASWSARG